MNIEIMVFNRETKVISTLLLKNGVNKINKQFVQMQSNNLTNSTYKELNKNCKKNLTIH